MAKVLVIDDSQDLLEFFSLILRAKGYEVETEPSFNNVIEVVSSFKPDVILLDVMLNGKDGRTLCNEIQRQDPNKYLPIILLSASPNLLEGYAKCGAIDAIEKPFTIDNIVEKIEVALQNRLT